MPCMVNIISQETGYVCGRKAVCNQCVICRRRVVLVGVSPPVRDQSHPGPAFGPTFLAQKVVSFSGIPAPSTSALGPPMRLAWGWGHACPLGLFPGGGRQGHPPLDRPAQLLPL